MMALLSTWSLLLPAANLAHMRAGTGDGTPRLPGQHTAKDCMGCGLFSSSGEPMEAMVTSPYQSSGQAAVVSVAAVAQ